ncbi:Ig-like domain-containing protein [Trueperella sp. LYQ141]|uniref:Ig-like domain-containing protein n=1 Tax=Trueperella sp. LYQ141 TaxID=3391058 RepID=UPI003983B70B
MRSHHWTSTASAQKRMRRMMAAGLVCLLPLSLTATAHADPIANPNSALGYPTFHGDNDPVPAAPAAYDPSHSYLGAIFDADVKAGAGTSIDKDFWIDAMLARRGADPTGTGATDTGTYKYEGADHNEYLFSRGRAAFMKTHIPDQLGFMGDLAYWESIDGRPGFDIKLSVGDKTLTMKEDPTQRKQTPSYFTTVFTAAESDISVREVKYMTENNVLVAELQMSSPSGATVTVTASSPYATTANEQGNELSGVVRVQNNLTTIYPRFSGTDMKAADAKLVGTYTLGAGAVTRTKIQLGLIAPELPLSQTEYEARATGDLRDPAASYTDHVKAYNAWWVANIPYVETGDATHNIDKTIFYRWWLTRFNFLDADMPGNTFQFPTAVEGALGYNNAIVLTTGMFLNDVKYLRDPAYAYGTWISAGEAAKDGKQYIDNPGDPANWRHSYTQYITDAAWESYKVHGGPTQVADALGTYGAADVNGLLNSHSEPIAADNQNDNKNYLIDWSWASMTGNDADAVSFDQFPGERMDRPETANLWANARAAAQAYEAAGNTAGAAQMNDIAGKIQQNLMSELWNSDQKLLLSKYIGKHNGTWAKWKEINNYFPYAVGMVPMGNADYDSALRLFADADQYPVFPFFTANQADKKEFEAGGGQGSNNFSVINSTMLFRIYDGAIRHYHAAENGYITNEQFKKLLYWNAFAHYQGGDNRYPDQNEFWNTATGADGGKIEYRSWIHHTQLGTTNWTMIESVAGLVPRQDDVIELNPIVIPGWEHFTVNNLSYHGKDLTIVWNNDGHYTAPAGYSIYLDGKLAATVDRLAHIRYNPNSGTVEVADQSGAKVTTANTTGLGTANSVTYDSTSRITEMFARAGRNIDPAAASQTDVARGAAIEASYSAQGHGAEYAVDGRTVHELFWGSAGSPNATDSLTLTFPSAQTIDDVRLFFYQTSSSATVSGYAEPSVYTLEYQDASGAWKTIPDQARTPIYPQPNYNHIQFPAITTQKLRVNLTHAAGFKTGVKEIEAFHTGIAAGPSTNQAPSVSAYVAANTSAGAQLIGQVKDDGLPAGTIAATWEMVSGPAGAKVSFADPHAASTTATFPVEGEYELKLSATDGEKSAETTLKLHGIPSDGTVNIAPQGTPKASSINTYLPKDNVKVVNDLKVDPAGSKPNMSWNNWGQGDKEPWVQYTWAAPVPLAKAALYLWSDGGGVPMPAAWKIQYFDKASGKWTDVTLKEGASYDVSKGEALTVPFQTVWSDQLRVLFTPKPDQAVGISEFEAYAVDPNGVEEVARMVPTGSQPDALKLPQTVSVSYPDGTRANLAVIWPEVTADQLASDGEFTLTGTVVGSSRTASAHISVKSDANSAFNNGVNSILPVEQSVVQGSAQLTPPPTVTGRYMNGGTQSGLKVTWNSEQLAAVNLNAVGDYTVSGVVEGTSAPATLTVHVIPGRNVTPPEKLEGWIEPKASSVTTSVAASWSPAAGKLNDGIVVDDTWPTQDDQDVNAKVWGTWGQAVDGMYAEYRWPSSALIDTSRVMFWANMTERDEKRGGLEIPDSWEIQYYDSADGTFKPVKDAKYTTVRNDPSRHATEAGGWSVATFTPVETSRLRLVLHPHLSDSATFGTAVAEWQVHALAEQPAVDKSGLHAALAGAAALQQERYTPESWAAFADVVARAQAVYDDPAADQKSVDAAAASIAEAQKTLVLLADKSALIAAINAAHALDSGQYTPESWAQLAAAVQQGQTVVDNPQATQDEIDRSRAAIDAARAQLVGRAPTPSVDKAELKSALDRAVGLTQSNYTVASWQALHDAVLAAQGVMADEQATQAQVDAALQALLDAITQLVPTNSSAPGGALVHTGVSVVGVSLLSLLLLGSGWMLVQRRRVN